MDMASSIDQDFRTLVEVATDAIMVIGGDGTILYANDAAGELFGHRPADLLGLPFGHPAIHGQISELDIHGRHRRRVAEMRVSSVRWEGEASHVIILRDVSDRVRMAAELRDRLAFEQLLLEISATFARARSSDRQMASAQALGLFCDHVRAEQALLLARTETGAFEIIAFYPADERVSHHTLAPALGAVVEACLRDNRVQSLVGTTLAILDDEPKDGPAHWIGILPLTDGEEGFGALCLMRATPPGLGAAAYDLEALRPAPTLFLDALRRMRLEDLLTRAMIKQASVFRQLVEGLCLVRGRRVVQGNQALADMMGYRIDELPGLETRAFFANEESYKAVGEQGYRDVREGRLYSAEHLFERRNGERFWGELKGAPVEGEDDTDGESVWVLRDITDLREAATRKQQLIDELSRSNAELERFAFIASHDLKEPVRMVASYVNLLSKRYGNSFDGEGREFLNFALEGARRIHQMIEGILDYARIEASSPDLDAVALEAPLDRALASLADILRESRAQITVQRPLPTVLAVPSEMERVFVNLIGNAVKFAKPDQSPRIDIMVETCPSPPKGKDQGSPLCHVTIRDAGIGIPEAEREKVFDIFWRLHGREKYDGTGLGLAIVKRIIDRRGGRVWIESREGLGTTIHILQPVAPSP
ncbi:PAS domain-containing sensor histidine kinase [Rhodospirillum rubrum]|nr:PAS domain-containing sensor histidine kinase [Rhodospirillum rubrum]MBK1677135.1 PAS domain-containing sensor histidine kinase [Rhodospirillum rubrum]